MKNKKSKRFNPLLGTATPQHHRMLCTAMMSVSLIIACNAQASDVEVYHQGAQFDKRLMLMVDQSRTMGSRSTRFIKRISYLCGERCL